MLNHRSIRKYTAQDISADVLNDILVAGTRASNTGNMQTYSVVVTRSHELKAKLAPAHFNQPMVTSAPVVLTICADVNRFIKWCQQRNANVGFNNFQSFIGATVDAVLFAENIALAAEQRGLGLCFLGTTTYNADQIIKILNLPAGVMPITTITLGYPDEDPSLTPRLPLDAVVHEETYHDFTPADIDRIYADLEADPSSAKFIAENNKQTLAQVFAEVRYPADAAEHFSKVFLDALKQQNLL